jgi:hypothetical protein
VVDHLGRGRSALANGHGGEAPRESVDSGSAGGLDRRAVLGPGALAAQQDGETNEIALAGVGR